LGIGRMRVLVTFAVEAEFAPWRKLRQFRKSKLQAKANEQGAVLYQANGEAKSVEVLLTGIGRKVCGESLLQYASSGNAKPDLVISSGLAGALKEDFKPGDLVVARKVRTLRNDANADSDHTLLERAVQSGARVIETLITAERLVPTAIEKERLSFFGEAVDMESAFVMTEFVRSAACVTIRAISDTANEDLPLDFDRCLTPQGEIKTMKLVNEIVRRPGNLPNLVRFGRQSNAAANSLAGFLDKFVSALPSVLEGVGAR
jgi:adenosylhomocysteine nucleosidase